MDEADISAAVSAVACKIFGRDGWKKSARRPIPLRGVLDCTRAWVVTIWKSWARKVGRDRNVLEKLETDVAELKDSKLIDLVKLSLSLSYYRVRKRITRHGYLQSLSYEE